MEENIYDSILKRIRPFEIERRKVLAILIFREIIVFMVLFFLIKCFILCKYDSDAAVWFLVMIFGVLYYSFYDITHTNKLFKKDIKLKVIYILQDFFNIRGIRKSSVSKSQLMHSNLFPYFEEVNVDDGYSGCHNSVDYSILEAKLTAKSPKRFDITTFKGLIVLYEFNKNILKDTIVTRKNDDNIRQNLHGLNVKRIFVPLSIMMSLIVIFAFLASGGIKSFDELFFAISLIIVPLACGFIIFGLPFLVLHFIQQRKQKMTKTEMEDIVFNKDYIIHTKDPVEARYLITTAFMERFLKLQKIFKTKNIKCSFFDKDKLMIAIPARKDLFEVCSLFSLLKNKKYIEKFYNDIEDIKKIIDVFKLNERTGL